MDGAWYKSRRMIVRTVMGFMIVLGVAGFVACGLSGCSDNTSVVDDVEMISFEEIQKLADRDMPYEESCDAECETEGTVDIVPFCDSYAYDNLSEGEKIWYRDMKKILENRLEKQELSLEGLDEGFNENSIDKIFQCVLNDHPEYFYVEGYTYTTFTRLDEIVKLEFSGTYSMNEKEIDLRAGEIEEEVERVISGIDEDASDYEKIKYVYETLIQNTQYDLDAPDNQNIYSVFVNHRSVCQGYAKATQYLLNRLGVECTLVVGTVLNGDGHAWNLVKADGSYYYLDTTWGDASYLMESTSNEKTAVFDEYLPEISYDYMCVDSEQILKTHSIGGVVPMPVCDSMENNYFVREGLYFTDADEDSFRRLFAQVRSDALDVVMLKCADSKVYEEIDRLLIKEQKIFDYLGDYQGQIAFAQNNTLLSMTFWVTNE